MRLLEIFTIGVSCSLVWGLGGSVGVWCEVVGLESWVSLDWEVNSDDESCLKVPGRIWTGLGRCVFDKDVLLDIWLRHTHLGEKVFLSGKLESCTWLNIG